jgi:ribosomal protein S18 acetylase RimI-like enzyme
MIRPFAPSDTTALYALTILAFDGVSMDQNLEGLFGDMGGTTWQDRKRAHVDADIAAHPEGIFVAEEDGRIVGWVSTRVDERIRTGWIINLAVHPDAQGHGLGRALIEAALAHLRDAGMEYAGIATLEQNERTRRWYPEMGFGEFARQIHYMRKL